MPNGNRLLKTKATGGAAAKSKSDYDKILNTIYKALGRGVTTDNQLNRIGKKLLAKRYIGTFPQDIKPQQIMPKTRAGNCYFIINTDLTKGPGLHWVSVYYSKADDKFYVYDSFARSSCSLLPHFIRTIGSSYIDINKKGDQANDEDNCGQRSLAFLIFVHKHGIAAARHI